ncbi:nuclear transport factor 2 family protein [Schlesneria paludicola]|uniref:nuclear transport factor 2 family protein n=1 Tax=Schlesneria paludicola TaxID=360056 RepID=UPI00029B4A16|nr:nuclear transport factor 2 family protein [Schlesneria paludicola]
MSDAEENVRKLRVAYKMWNDSRGESSQHWLDLMADDVKMTSLASSHPSMEFTKAVHGKSQAEDYFAGLKASWEMVHFTAEEFVAQGDRVVMLGRCAFRSRLTGKTAESAKADVYRFRDGCIVEFFDFYDTAAAYVAGQLD